jgi:dUTP pyrophosphatase
MTQLGIKVLDSRVNIPVYAHKGDAGLDVFPLEEYELLPGETKLIKLGFALDIPIGYEVQIRSRSGLTLKHQVVVLNAPATIDSGFVGEVGVILRNFKDTSYKIVPRQAIAQLVLAPVAQAKIHRVEQIVKDSDRGTGGYGSTDELIIDN